MKANIKDTCILWIFKSDVYKSSILTKNIWLSLETNKTFENHVKCVQRLLIVSCRMSVWRFTWFVTFVRGETFHDFYLKLGFFSFSSGHIWHYKSAFWFEKLAILHNFADFLWATGLTPDLWILEMCQSSSLVLSYDLLHQNTSVLICRVCRLKMYLD